MNHVYVPADNISDYKCYEFIDRHTIRAYLDTPTYNSNIRFQDIYLDMEYYMTGVGTTWFWWNSESSHANLPSCIQNSRLTNEVYYRNDFDKSLIIFVILAIICLYLPFRLFMKLFKRGRL